MPAGDPGPRLVRSRGSRPASNSSKGAGTPAALGTHLHTPPEQCESGYPRGPVKLALELTMTDHLEGESTVLKTSTFKG